MEAEKRIRLVECEALEGFRVRLRFDDGVEGVVDLSHLRGGELFEPWEDPAFFKTARVAEWGALMWDEDIDLCPYSLYLRVTGLKPEDIFPRLREPVAHA